MSEPVPVFATCIWSNIKYWDSVWKFSLSVCKCPLPHNPVWIGTVSVKCRSRGTRLEHFDVASSAFRSFFMPIYIYMLFCHHMAGGGQVRNQWISGLFGYTQNALTCRIYLAGSVETFTSVKRRCHASRTCFAVSKLQCTFNSWDLSAHRLYRPCGPARTRIVWSALALKKMSTSFNIQFFSLN